LPQARRRPFHLGIMRSMTARNAAEILSPGKETLHNTSLRIIHLVDVDAVARRIFVGPAHGNDADVLGTEAEGKDIAQVLAVANALEGTDGSHVVSPWLSEPATIAVSMAIKSPQAIDDAPVRAGAQRRMAAQRLSCLREEWAKPRGRKSWRRHCGKAIEAQPSLWPDRVIDETASSRASGLQRKSCVRGTTQEPASRSKESQTSRTERLLAFPSRICPKNAVSNAVRFDDIGGLYRIAAGTARSRQA
jgi:hypothetical protein